MNYVARFPNITPPKGAQMFSEGANPELEHKVKKATDKFSENINTVANEPSLAFYRIQEHVRKTMPQLVEKRHEVQDIQEQVQGSCFDMEYAIGAVKGMQESAGHFQSIQSLLKNAMFMKQQISYEQSRREQEKNKPSMYRRSTGMLRTNTVDIPVSGEQSAEFSSSLQNPPVLAGGSPRGRSSSLSESPRNRPK